MGATQSNTSAAGTGPSLFVLKMVAAIDKTSSFLGKGVSLLILPMMFALVFEVVSRYCFDAPTIWAGDVALILYGIYFMMASPYCLKAGGHIRTDFLYSHWSIKRKGMIDTITYLFFYFPVHALFLEIACKYFYKSFLQGETMISSPWMPIVWPLKLAIPVSIFFMLLQGVSEITKSYYAWRHGTYYWVVAGEDADVLIESCEPSTLK